MEKMKLFLVAGLVLCVAGAANAALVNGAADLNLTDVVKAINFGEDAVIDAGGGTLATNETVGSTTFLVSNVNVTVDGVTNTASDGVSIGFWDASSPEFGSTTDDDALERVFASSVYHGSVVYIDVTLPSDYYKVQVLLYEGWDATSRNVSVTAESTVADPLIMGT